MVIVFCFINLLFFNDDDIETWQTKKAIPSTAYGLVMDMKADVG